MPKSQTEVYDMFAPSFPTLWKCILDAFNRFFEINREELGAIHDRTKASYINDLVVRNLKERLPATLKPSWESKKGQRHVWLEGVVCLRVKKVNKNLQPHNLATQSQFDFYERMIAPRFFNMPAPIPLLLGFTTNRLKTAPERLFIIHADGTLNNSRRINGIESIKPRIMWAIEVPKSGEGVVAKLPLFQQPQEPKEQHRQVRAKNIRRKRNDKNDESK